MSSTTGSIWMLNDVEPGGRGLGLYERARDWRRVYTLRPSAATAVRAAPDVCDSRVPTGSPEPLLVRWRFAVDDTAAKRAVFDAP